MTDLADAHATPSLVALFSPPHEKHTPPQTEDTGVARTSKWAHQKGVCRQWQGHMTWVTDDKPAVGRNVTPDPRKGPHTAPPAGQCTLV